MPTEALLEPRVTSPNLHMPPSRPAGWWARRKQIVAPFLLLAAALATYAPALRNGFVWDDQALVVRDPLIRSWRLIWEGFQHFLFTDASASDFYRPLQRLSYTLDYAAFFVSPMGYHLVSILWHAAAAIALFYFAEEFLGWCKMESTRRFGVAFLTALVWSLHPVQSAAVVYVAGRADPLAAVFGFCGLFLGLRMLRASGNRKWAFGGGAALCFLASALSKEMGLIFLLLWFNCSRRAASARGIVRRDRSLSHGSDRLPEFAPAGGTHRATRGSLEAAPRSSDHHGACRGGVYGAASIPVASPHGARRRDASIWVCAGEHERRVMAGVANAARSRSDRGRGLCALALAPSSRDLFPAPAGVCLLSPDQRNYHAERHRGGALALSAERISFSRRSGRARFVRLESDSSFA